MFRTMTQQRFHDEVSGADDDGLRVLQATYDGLADLVVDRADEVAWKMRIIADEAVRRGLCA